MRQVALLLAKEIRVSEEGAVDAILEPLDTVVARTPASLPVCVYFAVEYDQGDVGRICSVSFYVRDLDVVYGDAELISSDERVHLGPRQRAGLAVCDVPLRLSKPGTYEFAIMLDSLEVATTTFLVVERRDEPRE